MLIGKAHAFIDVLEKADVPISLNNAKRVLSVFESARQDENGIDYVIDGQRHDDFRGALVNLGDNMGAELGTKLFVCVAYRNSRLFSNKKAFGDDVDSKFPSIAYDIEESAKCLSLERSTASAVHSIRCLEGAIRALTRCLGIPDPTKAADRNWGRLLNGIKSELDRRWPTSSNRLSGDGRFFDEAYAALAAMQNPWRNATMHLDQIYTQDVAQDVFNTVGGFMRRIAARLDENGDPKA
jgi:hypothetical protein